MQPNAWQGPAADQSIFDVPSTDKVQPNARQDPAADQSIFDVPSTQTNMLRLLNVQSNFKLTRMQLCMLPDAYEGSPGHLQDCTSTISCPLHVVVTGGTAL